MLFLSVTCLGMGIFIIPGGLDEGMKSFPPMFNSYKWHDGYWQYTYNPHMEYTMFCVCVCIHIPLLNNYLSVNEVLDTWWLGVMLRHF